MKLYTKDQIERACRQAAESLYWQYYEGGFPTEAELAQAVSENLAALEELEPVTEVHIPHDITCKCEEC